jgi:NADH:ubiquinone oxidoreductase subunit H
LVVLRLQCLWLCILHLLKIAAWLQDRIGPRAGKGGLLQPSRWFKIVFRKKNLNQIPQTNFLFYTGPAIAWYGIDDLQ